MEVVWVFGGVLLFAILAGIITRHGGTGVIIGVVLLGIATILGYTAIAVVIVWSLGIFCDVKMYEECAEERQHRREARAQEKCRPLKEKILQDLSRQKGILNARRSKLRAKTQTDEITLAFLDLVALCDHDATFLEQASVKQRRNEYSVLLATQRRLDSDIARIDAQRKKVKDCADYPALKAMANSTRSTHA